jgi:RNA-directed DNA polymerase
MTPAYTAICAWDNLLLAWRKAFEHDLADNLLALQAELREQRYRPGPYVNFFIHEPKQRKISAAPFRDRVVHHALCNVLEPRFERLFIADSYANRRGKGTHRAVDRVQYFAQRYRYALRCDVVQHFAAIDHAILQQTIARVTPEADVMALVASILASGTGLLDDQYRMVWFPGDDLLAACRPRGLPIGNLTSQFWSNCYLHPFDQFVARELRCPAYVRYVDDFILFSDRRDELWLWKRGLIDRLARLRLAMHDATAQVVPVDSGIPWLGFVVYPTHRRVKARKVIEATRRLKTQHAGYRAATIGKVDLDASVQGWINHVRYADSWGLRRHMLGGLRLRVKL